MSTLKNKDKRVFEELFDMQTGYVLDFSNSSFADFIEDEIGLDVYNSSGYEEYCSKANKLRQIWSEESDYKVGILMLAMLEHCEDLLLKTGKMDAYKEKKILHLKNICNELKTGADITVQLPMSNDNSLSLLFDDIDTSLKQNKPESALDRLHTYSTKYLRETCEKNSIKIRDEKGDYYPLSNLAGSLRKVYEKDPEIKSRFSIVAIKSSISLFEQFNDVRNNYSYAHDNENLSYYEAKYIIKIMSETLLFIEEIEKQRLRELDT